MKQKFSTYCLLIVSRCAWLLFYLLHVTKEHATQEEGGPAVADLTHLWHRDIYLKNGSWQLSG